MMWNTDASFHALTGEKHDIVLQDADGIVIFARRFIQCINV